VEAPLKLFNETIIKLQENDFNTGFTHIANSSAFIKYPQSHLDGVRIGSAFLGRIIEGNHLGLQKIGYLESEIIETNFLKKGSNIGYGNTFKTKKDTKTAIIPVGYAYGFMTEKSRDTFRLRDIARYILNDIKPRKFYCRINNKKCEILGRIGMFNIICDITDKNAEIGDKVILDANPILISDSIKRDYI
jgi:alanine racemase